MSFYIDPSGGIAGDMFSAMLISAGAPEDKVIYGMVTAARKLGIAEISTSITNDNSTRLNIHFHSKHAHIKGSKAKEILKELYDELEIQCQFREFGNKALDILIQAERQAHSENHFESDHYHINPIGVVKSPYTNKAPFRPDPEAKGEFYIELFQKYQDGLKSLEEFSHMYLLVYLDKSVGYSLHVNPPHHNVNVGVFASRSPFRPNPIGINIVEIKKIEKNRVYISPIDFIDNTPVLDIKPVIKSLDKVEGANNGWIVDEDMKGENVVIPENSQHNHGHDDAYLHEAQDIIIDIIGAVIGMQYLLLDAKAFITKPISVGGGMVKFSHGKLAVPSPATRIILEKYNIPFQMGPIEVELCTPTGAAIIAALDVELKENYDDLKVIGTSRGTKDLEIPPLKLLREI
ncbi:tRNA (N6-threonylcarbamoyladenosine(37)-N6)-methyltransferase TrmO [Bacteroidota bacterium]